MPMPRSTGPNARDATASASEPSTLPNVLRTVTATRYVTPLREGGSLPGLMEADDCGTYVVKFRGAGQGLRALVAEVIVGTLARGLGLPVPDQVVVEVSPTLAAGEPDEEIQQLLRASAGTNLGIDFLPGALDLNPEAFAVDATLAGSIVWFDALVGNVDRSYRNPNLLYWHGLRMIDHGAALTFAHRWEAAAAGDAREYDVSEHVLVSVGVDVLAADAELARRFTADLVRAATDEVPDEWLASETDFADAAAVRSAYAERILGRFAARDRWLPPLAASAALRGSDRVQRRSQRPDWVPNLTGVDHRGR